MRLLLAVFSGYLIFAVSALLLFQLTLHDPHATPTVAFAIGSVAWGMLFAMCGGFTAVRMARRPNLLASIILSGLIVTVALVSLISQSGEGSIWSQVSAILLM